MAEIRLLCSAFSTGTSKVLKGTVATVGLRKNNFTRAIENGTDKAIVATNSYENPIYTLNNIQLIGTTKTSDSIPLTYQNILEMLSLQNSGSTPILLKISYGIGDMVPEVTDSFSIVNQSSSGTIFDPNTFTDPSNFFDETSSTATKALSNGTQSVSLGKKFTSSYIDHVYAIVDGNTAGGGTEVTSKIYLEGFNGESWFHLIDLDSSSGTGTVSTSYSGYIPIKKTLSGIRAVLEIVGSTATTSSATFTRLNYGTPPEREIPVILESANITFDSTDSWEAYLPVASLTFVETR